jgi:hypothetical protein
MLGSLFDEPNNQWNLANLDTLLRALPKVTISKPEIYIICCLNNIIIFIDCGCNISISLFRNVRAATLYLVFVFLSIEIDAINTFLLLLLLFFFKKKKKKSF